MANIHNALRRSALSKGLTQALGDTRTDGGIERYGETLQPVIDLWDRPEWSYLRQEFVWQKSHTQVAVAGELAALGVTSGLNSDTIVVVESISVGGSSPTVEVCPMGRVSFLATLALQTGCQLRDLRPGIETFSLFAPNTEFWAGSDPVSLLSAGTRYDKVFAALGAMTPVLGGPWVLKPNSGIVVQATTVNQGLDVTVTGYSRLAPNELGT